MIFKWPTEILDDDNDSKGLDKIIYRSIQTTLIVNPYLKKRISKEEAGTADYRSFPWIYVAF